MSSFLKVNEIKRETNQPLSAKCFTALFVLYPILSVYAIGPLNLGQVFTIPFIIVFVFKVLREPIVIRPQVASELPLILCGLALFLFILSLVSCVFFPEITSIARIGKFVLLLYGVVLIIVAGHFIDRDLSIKLLKVSLVSVSTVLFIQHLVNILFNVQIQPYLPFIDTVSMDQTERVLLYQYEGLTVYRPASVFVEPSHFGLYCGFGLSFLLFIDRSALNRNDLLVSLFVSLAMLSSTSGVSIALVVICWGMYLLPRIREIPLSVSFIVIICVIAILFSLQKGGVLSVGISRLITSDGSGANRLLSSLPYFESASPLMKLIGCGIGNMTVTYESNMPFLSGMGILLLESGLIGSLAFVAAIAYMGFADNCSLFPFCVIIFAVSLIEQYLYGTYFAYSVVFPLYCSRKAIA